MIMIVFYVKSHRIYLGSTSTRFKLVFMLRKGLNLVVMTRLNEDNNG